MRRVPGFTLIEVLVALAVFGLLGVALTYGVRTGLAMWDAEQRHLGETADLDAAARVLRSLLTRIPARPSADGTLAGVAFARLKGSPDRFSYVGELPTGFGTSRLADLVLTRERGRLVLLWSPYRHEHPLAPPPPPSAAELLRGIDRLEFDYWGAPNPNAPRRWQAQWDALYPPQLIRIRVTFPTGDRRHWPDLLVAPLP
jgi:general secretion pathway protein J